MHQTPPDTTRHAPDTTRHYQTCTRQCLIGWQWSCDDLKSYTADPDFLRPQADERTDEGNPRGPRGPNKRDPGIQDPAFFAIFFSKTRKLKIRKKYPNVKFLENLEKYW